MTQKGGADRIVVVPARKRGKALGDSQSAQKKWKLFQEYLGRYYNDPAYLPLELGFLSRNRAQTPPHLENDLRPLLLKASLREKPVSADRFQEAQFLVASMADLVEPTAHHHTEGGIRVYYYYPRLSFDFSAAMRGLAPPDRVGSLHFIVRLRTEVPVEGDPIRFLQFSPKQADVVDFARGSLTTAMKAQLAASSTSTRASNLVTEDSEAGTTQTDGGAGALAQGPLSVTASETMVTQLVDAIERRSAGLLDEGRTFFASFRSLRDVKIAGTYNFDLMLEVPSRVESEGKFVKSVPVAAEIKADIFLIGIVRHVIRRGRVGRFTRVPENENDHTLDQVVVKVLPGQVLWKHGEEDEDWFDSVVAQNPRCKMNVVTNHERASFVVRNAEGVIVADGRGTGAEIELSPDESEGTICTAEVDFLSIVDLTDGKTNTLAASSVEGKLSVGKVGRVVGEYQSH